MLIALKKKKKIKVFVRRNVKSSSIKKNFFRATQGDFIERLNEVNTMR